MWWQNQKKKRSQGCELPLAFYNSFRDNNKVNNYAKLGKPRIEKPLQEIYRNFAVKLTEYEDELKDTFQIKGKFDPKQTREDLTKRKERESVMEKLKAQVENEIDRVYANKETKERSSVLINKAKGNPDDDGGETLRRKASGMSLNEDLFGLDTLEPADQGAPP